jgi:hypothetical protein
MSSQGSIRGKHFSLRHHGFGTQPVLYPMRNKGDGGVELVSTRVKWPKRETDRSLPFSANVQNTWDFLLQQKENFIFY